MSLSMRPVVEQWGPGADVPHGGDWAACILSAVVMTLVPGTTAEVHQYGDMWVFWCDNGAEVCSALAEYECEWDLARPFLDTLGWDEATEECSEFLETVKIMAPQWAEHLDDGALRVYFDA